MKNTVAIGDIQGCDDALDQLLATIASDSNRQTDVPASLIFVGDIVNRGPDSLGALRRIRALGERSTMLLGNHDLHLLATACGIRKPHASDTLNDILAAPDRDELLDWLRRQPLALLRDGHLFVHAGVVPQWSAEQTVALAAEVETVLRGPHWQDFLSEMYGNTPDQWRDDLRGTERLRCIVNVLTRIRFCSAQGRMDFHSKEGAASAPVGYLPWFDVPDRKSADVTVVCGHWSTLGLLMRPNLLALDTGCVWGGKLTGVRLDDRALFQVQCPQHQRPG